MDLEAWPIARVVECLPCMCEARVHPSTTNKKREDSMNTRINHIENLWNSNEVIWY
jgi:hypothetical protein